MDIQEGIKEQGANNHTQTEGENDHQLGCDNATHHKGKQGKGKSKNDCPLPDVVINLILFHKTRT